MRGKGGLVCYHFVPEALERIVKLDIDDSKRKERVAEEEKSSGGVDTMRWSSS